MVTSDPIFTSAVVFLSPDGEVLTARKRGTERFMLIGGKPEAGEQPRATAVREIREEIGLVIEPDALDFLGMWQTAAANEPGRQVHGTTFVARQPLSELPVANSEIAQLRWLNPTLRYPEDLAPLLAERILPALSGRVFPWDIAQLPIDEYVFPGPLRDRLLAAMIAGLKTTTSSLMSDYDPSDPLPEVGQFQTVIDSADCPVGLTETTRVQLRRSCEIDLAFAVAEGEGFESVAQWRQAHEEFWGRRLTDDELIVCETIRYYPLVSS